MIKSDQQYKATKDQIEKFEAAIADLDAGRNLKPGLHPQLIKAQKDALNSELEILRKDLKEYDRANK